MLLNGGAKEEICADGTSRSESICGRLKGIGTLLLHR